MSSIIDDIAQLVSAEKSVAGIPEWAKDKRDNGEIRCAAPLWCNGEVRLGMRFEFYGPEIQPPDRPFFGMTALLFANISGETLHLSRLEFDPQNPLQIHRNTHPIDGAPPEVSGPHYHPFFSNMKLGIEAFGRTRDLPVAFPFEQKFITFDSILDVVRDQFVIPGLWLEEPPCSTRIV